MADINNVDIVNIKDVNLFDQLTDIEGMKFAGKKVSDGSNALMLGTALLTHIIGSTDLGTFTGSIITDNVSIKTALQELETSLAAAGGTSFSKIDLGKLQAIGINGEVGYSGSAGQGTITIDDPWSLKSAALYIDIDTDTDGSNNFDLVITVTNGTYNTWTGTGTHDLWIPQIQVWDAGPTELATKELGNISLGNSTVIAPDIVYGSNSVTYKFLGSSDFGSKDRILVTIKP